MGRASERLRAVEEAFSPGSRGARGMATATVEGHVAVAQAWVAYARELTARTRAGGGG